MPSSANRSQRRILLVDDEPTIAVTLGDDLVEHGFAVTCVGDGAQAVRLLAATAYDAVITDLRLPGAGGGAVLGAAKRAAAAAPVLVISASPAAESAVRAQGADGFLQKPFANTAVLAWLAGLNHDGARSA